MPTPVMVLPAVPLPVVTAGHRLRRSWAAPCTLLLATFNQPGLHLLPSGRLPIQVVIGE